MTKPVPAEKYKDVAFVDRMDTYRYTDEVGYRYSLKCIYWAAVHTALMFFFTYLGFGYEYILGSILIIHFYSYGYYYRASKKLRPYFGWPGVDYTVFVLFFVSFPLTFFSISLIFFLPESAQLFLMKNNGDVISFLLQSEVRKFFQIPNVFYDTNAKDIAIVYGHTLVLISSTFSCVLSIPLLLPMAVGIKDILCFARKDPDSSVAKIFNGFKPKCFYVLWVLFMGWSTYEEYSTPKFSFYGYRPYVDKLVYYSDSTSETVQRAQEIGIHFYTKALFGDLLSWSGTPVLLPLTVASVLALIFYYVQRMFGER